MNTAGKLSAYGVVLALVAGGAWAVGTAVGPISATPAPSSHHGMPSGDGHGNTHGGTSRVAEVDGYQVRLDGELIAGQSSPLRLTVSKDGVVRTAEFTVDTGAPVADEPGHAGH